jgi:hypothetical protein
LEQRKQRVEICYGKGRRVHSNWETVKYGVPQGSVLFPLFLIYINDLPLGMNFNCEITLYADDTSVLIFGNNAQDLQVKAGMALNALKYSFTNKGLYLKLTENKNVKV